MSIICLSIDVFKFEFTIIDIGLCVLSILFVAWHFITKVPIDIRYTYSIIYLIELDP